MRKTNMTLVCMAAVGLILYFIGEYLMKPCGLGSPDMYHTTGLMLVPASFLCVTVCRLMQLFMLRRKFRNRSN